MNSLVRLFALQLLNFLFWILWVCYVHNLPIEKSLVALAFSIRLFIHQVPLGLHPQDLVLRGLKPKIFWEWGQEQMINFDYFGLILHNLMFNLGSLRTHRDNQIDWDFSLVILQVSHYSPSSTISLWYFGYWYMHLWLSPKPMELARCTQSP